MKIVLPGGSGQVGRVLSRAFVGHGHDVVVLSRGGVGHFNLGESARVPEESSSPPLKRWGTLRCVEWDGESIGKWAGEIDGADVVINLAGRSVNCRYNATNRRAMMESRVKSTRVVGEAIARASKPPRVWLQASTATIYAHRYDAPNDEATGIIGGAEKDAPDAWRFSIEVATAWERAANEAMAVCQHVTSRSDADVTVSLAGRGEETSPSPSLVRRGEVQRATRLVLMRSAMTMSPDRGGIFDTLLGLVRKGIGGRSGDGRQYVSWIHERDFVRAVYWLIEHDELSGVVNVCSPNPLTNGEFMRTLRGACSVRIGLSSAAWMLAIGAVLMRTETELILKSRRVVPGRLIQSGFAFEYPEWKQAAEELCGREDKAKG